MILWGFIMLLAGLIACLVTFFGNLDLFTQIANVGLGKYIAIFFDKQYLTSDKVIFVIGAAVLVVGAVLYFLGRGKKAKAGEKNPIIPAKVSKFFRDTRGEFKKIVWPGFPTVVRNTVATLVMCAIVGAIIVVIDFGLSELVKLLLNL